jgi:Methyltransferase domain
MARRSRRKLRRTLTRGQRLAGRYWLLLKLRRTRGNGAEVGSWKGDSAARFVRWVNPKRLTLIDPWQHTEMTGYEFAMYAGEGGQADMERVYESVLARFKDEIAQGRIVVRRESSLQAADDWADGSLDWVYIDGDHRYDAVRADLEAWWLHLKPGGVLTGDDFNRKGWWSDGVTKAVTDFAQAHSCPVKVVGAQFLIRKPQ